MGTGTIGVVAVAVWAASAVYMWHFGPRWHLDLRVYRAAGLALRDHGGPFRSLFTANHLPFTYPPFALLVLTPLSFGPLGLVEGAWWVVNAAALVASLYLLIPSNGWGTSLSKRGRLAIGALIGGVATLALEPVRSNMDYGQINLLLMFFVVVDLRQSRRGFRGLTVGLAAAIKLTPIVFLLYYAVRRDFRSLAQGLASFLAFSLLAWAILPADSTLYWFHMVANASRTGPVGFVSNQSWYGLVHRPPFTAGSGALALWVALCLGVVVLGCLVLHRLAMARRPLVESVLILALVEALVSPISWTHHWSWMVVAPLAAFSLWRDHRWVSAAIIAALVVSVVAPYWWGFHRGVGGFVTQNSLVLAGACVLVAAAGAMLPRRSGEQAAVRPDAA